MNLVSRWLIPAATAALMATRIRRRPSPLPALPPSDGGVPWEDDDVRWTAARLRSVLMRQLGGDHVIVVANREPYIHEMRGRQVEVLHPASGLVTALEPVLEACSGTWIAHGSGSADRANSDAAGALMVPPNAPRYRLRRVWLTAEEEKGYYYGAANEALWPLCHLAHARPIFRRADWEHYRAVNARFADAVVAEAGRPDPIVLVQDYHFALLPRLIRERLPRATILTFWHIPWPNSERFGICPWAAEIVDGLLGSTIIGFHTQLHCNNFLDTADRSLELRVDPDHHSIVLANRETTVRPYPISIEWPSRWISSTPSVPECAAHRRDAAGSRSHVGDHPVHGEPYSGRVAARRRRGDRTGSHVGQGPERTRRASRGTSRLLELTSRSHEGPHCGAHLPPRRKLSALAQDAVGRIEGVQGPLDVDYSQRIEPRGPLRRKCDHAVRVGGHVLVTLAAVRQRPCGEDQGCRNGCPVLVR
jgi:hypothetical protein